MLALFLLFVLVPAIELYVIVQVAHAIGVLDTIGLLLALSIVGAWFAKRQGMYVIARIRQQLEARRMPTNDLIDGGLVLAGGVLLVIPGFVTGAVGLLLLLPPTRAVARAIVRRRFAFQIAHVDMRRRPSSRSGPDDVIDV